jgi:hypothetical protein
MLARVLPGGARTAIAGAGLLFVTAAPSAALSLSSPSLDQPSTNSGVEKVWWGRWGCWHPNRPWG